MADVFEFVAEARDGLGSSSARASRREGRVPAVVYGGNGENELITLDHNEVVKHLSHKEVYTATLNLNVGGKVQKAVLKHIQRHPAKPQVLHIDFFRVA
ncbi:MAG: 50S ribosomal protein L25 [Methylococcaceae bacterium]|nr:50S ribosomal protein L25 [Methylococcaceae bacterium]